MQWRHVKDRCANVSIRSSLTLVNLIAFIIVVVLFIKAKPILAIQPLAHLLFSSSWHPLKGQFGFLPFIVGTLGVTAIAMVMSIPVCLLSAIYLSEYAHKHFRGLARLIT